jgi:hypothetical protein
MIWRTIKEIFSLTYSSSQNLRTPLLSIWKVYERPSPWIPSLLIHISLLQRRCLETPIFLEGSPSFETSKYNLKHCNRGHGFFEGGTEGGLGQVDEKNPKIN